MMLKKMCLLAVAAVVACTATTGFAQITIIGDFEGASNDYDGWVVNNAIGTSTSFDSGIHATSGAQALSLFSNSGVSGAGNNFNWALTLTDDVLKALPEAKLMADVSWTTSEWNANTGWVQLNVLAVNSELGWVQFAPSADTSNPGSPGGWDPNNYGASDTRTLTWEFSNAITDSAGWKASSYNQINIGVNWDGAITAGGSFWIDNIRLVVPEPTCFALLGIGGGVLGLVRRRR